MRGSMKPLYTCVCMCVCVCVAPGRGGGALLYALQQTCLPRVESSAIDKLFSVLPVMLTVWTSGKTLVLHFFVVALLLLCSLFAQLSSHYAKCSPFAVSCALPQASPLRRAGICLGQARWGPRGEWLVTICALPVPTLIPRTKCEP